MWAWSRPVHLGCLFIFFFPFTRADDNMSIPFLKNGGSKVWQSTSRGKPIFKLKTSKKHFRDLNKLVYGLKLIFNWFKNEKSNLNKKNLMNANLFFSVR
jgi:hypothetical protein